MSVQVQNRRGTALQHESFVGAVGEVTVVTDDSTLRVHDGLKIGGHGVASVSTIDYSIWGDRYVGTFASGFTYTSDTDVARGKDGRYYSYIGNDSYPVVVAAGTVAGGFSGLYGAVNQDTSDYLSLKIFKSPTDGLTKINTRTLAAGQVYEVRKVSDDSLATIYSDAAGATEIVQNGTNNVSDSNGIVKFFVTDGDYYIEVGSARNDLNVQMSGAKTTLFNSVADLKVQKDVNGKTLKLSGMIGSYVKVLEYTSGVQDSDIEGWVSEGSHTEDGGYIITIAGNLYLKVNVKKVDLKRWGVIGGAIETHVTPEQQKEDLSLRNIRSTNILDEKLKVQKALNYAKGKFTHVYSNGLDFAVDITDNVPLKIPSKVTLDLQQGSIVRVGSDNGPTGVGIAMIQNESFNSPTQPDDYDRECGVINGKIIGNYDENGASDQGSGITFWKVYKAKFTNLVTMETEGDGILTRDVTGTLLDVQIGNFGRNGISPTDGHYYHKNVEIYGAALAGANPGLAFDAEVENGGFRERSTHIVDGLRCKEAYFVDLKGTVNDGDNCRMSVYMSNSVIGRNAATNGVFRACYLRTTAKTVNSEIVIDDTNTFIVAGTRGSGLYIDNISGVTVGAMKVVGTSGTNHAAVDIIGEVKNLTINNLIPSDGIVFSLRCEGSNNTIDDSNVRFGGLIKSIYVRGSNNYFKAKRFGLIGLFDDVTTGNTFDGNANSQILAYGTSSVLDNTFTRSRPSQGGNIRRDGGVGQSVFTRNFSLSNSDAPSTTITIPLEDAGDGRVWKLILQFTTSGSGTDWLHRESIIRAGSTSSAEAAVIHDLGDGVNTGITVDSVTQDEVVVTLTHRYTGNLVYTLIG